MNLFFEMAFSCRIFHVFPVSSKKQMKRLATWRIIARVTDFSSFWNFTFVQSVGKLMGINQLFINPKLTVSGLRSGIYPEPASRSASFFDTFPKSFYRIFARTFFTPAWVTSFNVPAGQLFPTIDAIANWMLPYSSSWHGISL